MHSPPSTLLGTCGARSAAVPSTPVTCATPIPTTRAATAHAPTSSSPSCASRPSRRHAPARAPVSAAAATVASAAPAAPPAAGRPAPHFPDETGRNPLASPSSLPLQGKRIIVTAPRQYAHKLCSKLINAGAWPLVIPGVQITELQDHTDRQQLRTALEQLVWTPSPAPASPPASIAATTHIAFTSKNGIFSVLEPLAELLGGADAARDWLNGSGLRLCALGADADALTQRGIRVHVVPAEASTQGLVRELAARGEAGGAHVLCPVPLVAGGLHEPPVVPRFLAALEAAGAVAVRLPAYLTTLGCSPSQVAAERAALEGGLLHAVAFSSTAEAQGLAQVMGGVEALRDALQRHNVLLAAHGPYTAEGAGAVLGLPVRCVSKNFSTFDGLVAALEAHFAAEAAAGHGAL